MNLQENQIKANAVQLLLTHYLVAVISVAAALLINVLVAPYLTLNFPLLIFFTLAIVVSAWYGGFGPGALSSLLSIIIILSFQISPKYSSALSNLDGVFRIVAFFLIGLLISALSQIKLSAQKRAEKSFKELSYREQELQALLNHAPDLISRFDRDLRCIYVNQSWLKITGLAAGEVLGKTHAELQTIVNAHIAWEPCIREVLETGREQEREYNFLVNEKNRFFHTFLTPEFGENGQTEYVLITERNITARKTAEIALRNSEQRYRSLTEATAQVVWQADAAGHIVDNPAWREITGQERDDVTPNVWLQFVHPDDRQFVLDAWADALRRQTTVEVEYRVQQKDRSYRDYLARGVPVFDEIGNVREWVGTTTDITESKRDKKALQKAKEELEKRVEERTEQFQLVNRALQDEIDERYRVEAELLESKLFVESVAKHPTLLIYVYDLDGNATVYSNHNVARFFGYSQNEIAEMDGDFLPKITHPDDWPELQQHIEKFKTARDNEIIEFERRVRNAQGEWRCLWSQEVIFKRHKNGSPAQIIGTAHDITERKNAEDALRQEKSFISVVLDTIEALIIVLDTEGRIVRFNNACEQISGRSFEEVEGKFFWEVFLLPEETEAVKSVFFQMCTGNFPPTFENHWVSKSGERYLISWASSVLRNEEGAIVNIIGTGIDITDQRQAENTLRQLFQHNRLLLSGFGGEDVQAVNQKNNVG